MGVINVFLGGTGKYIAEELKGTAAFYGITMPPFIAFDLDPASTHSGTFTLGSDLLGVGATFAEHAQGVLALRWTGLAASFNLAPAPNATVPGPTTRPEASIMERVGQDVRNLPDLEGGLWGMRSTGLLAYAAFTDSGSGGDGHAYNNLQQRLDAMLNAAVALNQSKAVRVNIVASTAGGTGAGLFAPFAFHIRDRAIELGIEVDFTLFVVTASAFDNENAGGLQERETMKSKARTGSFAILRELQLLHQVDDWAEVPVRELPVGRKGYLRYRLGGKPFSQVFWIGRRPVDTDAGKRVIYDEASRILALFSDYGFATKLASATGLFALRQVPTVVSVEYPKLRIARRLTGEIVVEAIDRLLGKDTDPGLNERLGDSGNGAIAAFFRLEKGGVFSDTTRGNSVVSPARMETLIKPFTQPFNDQDVSHGTGRTGNQGIYYRPKAEWYQYCEQLKTDMEMAAAQKITLTEQNTTIEIGGEGDTFARWLSQTLIPRLLTRQQTMSQRFASPGNPGREPTAPAPNIVTIHSLGTARNTIRVLRNDCAYVSTFFDRPMIERLTLKIPKAKAPEEIREAIKAKHEELKDPKTKKARKLSRRDHLLIYGQLVLMTLVFAWVLGLIGVDVVAQWLMATGGGLIASLLLRRFLAGRPVPEDQLRRAAEEELFQLYRDLMFSVAGREVFKAAKAHFVPPCEEAVSSAEDRLKDLTAVYIELRSHAQARIEHAAKRPPHVVDEIGTRFKLSQGDRHQLLVDLLPRIDVTPAGADLQDLRLEIHPTLNGTAVYHDVVPMAQWIGRKQAGASIGTADDGEKSLDDIDRAIEDSVIVTLGDQLPSTFHQALTSEVTDGGEIARMSEMLAKLVHMDPRSGFNATGGWDRRRPDNNPAYDSASVRRLVVSGDAEGILVQRALDPKNNYLHNLVKSHIVKDYLDGRTQPDQLPTIGQSIVMYSAWSPPRAATPWAPDLIAGTPEATEWFNSYYAVNRDSRRPENHHILSQWRRNFHILPELAAASAIEVLDDPLSPLHPLVVSRLLGSDHTLAGPTVLELFYLLRQRGLIKETVSGDDLQRMMKYSLQVENANVDQSVVLYSHRVGAQETQGDPFAVGRIRINCFDSFMDFLLFNGDPLETDPRTGNPADTKHRFMRLPRNQAPDFLMWAQLDHGTVIRTQQTAIGEWFKLANEETLETEMKAMLALVESDVAQMSPNVGRDWQRAAATVIRSGCSKRKQRGPA